MRIPRKLVLDSGPLGDAVRAPGHPRFEPIAEWIRTMTAAGATLVIPGIADYEVRRALILRGIPTSLERLDRLKKGSVYAPIGERVMLRAASLWARVRAAGNPTAGPEALDGDCILAAIALDVRKRGDEVIVITSNVGHLARFPGVDAREWKDVKP